MDFDPRNNTDVWWKPCHLGRPLLCEQDHAGPPCNQCLLESMLELHAHTDTSRWDEFQNLIRETDKAGGPWRPSCDG